MAAKAEDLRIIEKALGVTKKELSPVEYARFLEIITPKVGDSVREIRKFRDTITEEEFLKMLKGKGAEIIP
ncbi:MAG: hypothetical protein U9N61_13060 [Euryarchaeota archaeon]|nr:hypothetical protein [Euryarchaeota archaeon]